MKTAKTKKRYCPKCKKHTLHTVSLAKSGGKRGTLSRGSIARSRKRGLGRGFGNKGKWGSKPPITKFKRTGAKKSKKQDFRFKCNVCNKSSVQSSGFRAKRVEFK